MRTTKLNLFCTSTDRSLGYKLLDCKNVGQICQNSGMYRFTPILFQLNNELVSPYILFDLQPIEQLGCRVPQRRMFRRYIFCSAPTPPYHHARVANILDRVVLLHGKCVHILKKVFNKKFKSTSQNFYIGTLKITI